MSRVNSTFIFSRYQLRARAARRATWRGQGEGYTFKSGD